MAVYLCERQPRDRHPHPFHPNMASFFPPKFSCQYFIWFVSIFISSPSGEVRNSVYCIKFHTGIMDISCPNSFIYIMLRKFRSRSVFFKTKHRHGQHQYVFIVKCITLNKYKHNIWSLWCGVLHRPPVPLFVAPHYTIEHYVPFFIQSCLCAIRPF